VSVTATWRLAGFEPGELGRVAWVSHRGGSGSEVAFYHVEMDRTGPSRLVAFYPSEIERAGPP
jgi:hypothetical protein